MTTPPPNARFDIGRVIQHTASALFKNFGPLLAVSAVTVGLPSLLMAAGPLLALNPRIATAMVSAVFAGVLFFLVGQYVLQAAVIHGVIAHLNGGRATIGEMLATAMRRLGPMLLLAILIGVGVVAGLFLLVVPGVLLALAWSVAGPVLVVERTAVFKALSRSAELTRGYRWWILLLGLVAFAVSTGVSMLLGLLNLPLVVSTGPASPVAIVVPAIANALSAMIGAAGVGALYYELRLVKEGAAPDSLAAVFD
jgi:hypothetical protein